MLQQGEIELLYKLNKCNLNYFISTKHLQLRKRKTILIIQIYRISNFFI